MGTYRGKPESWKYAKGRITHGDSRPATAEYRAWRNMRNRCLLPTDNKWELYGGRGVTVCDRWLHDYAAFLADMGRKPSPKHTNDRINPDGHYEPGNCRWATYKEQNDHLKQRKDAITINGVTRSIVEWGKESGVSARVIYDRIDYGWDVKRAIFTPKRPKRKAIPKIPDYGAQQAQLSGNEVSEYLAPLED